MNKRIIFYSSVKSKRMFSVQGFYRTDITLLKSIGYKVTLSNSIWDFFKFKSYDLAFIYFYRYGLFPAIIARFFNKKTVFTGGIDYLDKEYAGAKSYYIQKLFFLLCSLFANKVILVSNSDKANIQNFKKSLSSSKYPTSFHVIKFSDFKFDFNTPKKKLVVTIAWMLRTENVLRKGVDKSLLLFKSIYQLDNDFRMIVIGPEGEGTLLLKQIIMKEGLEDLVSFTGSLSEIDKINILKSSLIYLQLSTYEGFGIAAIEALASGNLVVHSGKGGLKDGIGDNGILVESDNYDDIACKIVTTLSDTDLHSSMVSKGIHHVSSNFQYDKRLDDFKSILDSL